MVDGHSCKKGAMFDGELMKGVVVDGLLRRVLWLMATVVRGLCLMVS